MSNEHENNNPDQDLGLHGKRPVEGTVQSLNGNEEEGHQGVMTIGDSDVTMNFITTHGLKVKVGDDVRGEAQVDGTNTEGSAHRNPEHGGPKVLIKEIKSR